MPDLSQVVDWSAIPPSSQGTLPDAPSGASSQFPGLYGRYDEDVNALKAAAPALQPVVPQPTDYSATTAIKRLAGLDGEERYMLWPEKVVREGLSAAHDVSQPNPYQQGTEDYELYEQARQAAMIPAAVSMSALAGTGGLAAPSDATLGSGAFLRPALKYEGRIYKAPIKDPKNPAGFGAEHSDALPAHLADDFYKKAMTGDDINSYQFGFMNHKGQFMPREVALDYAVKEGLINPHDARYGTLTSTMLADSSKPGTAIEALAKRAEIEKYLNDKQGGFTNLGVDPARDPVTGAYVGTVPKFKGRDQGGRFQKAVDPYRNLPDINAETFGEAEAKKAERYRINGKFATTADYFRQRVPTDEELTKIRQNEFYNDKNAPSKEELDKIIDRLHQANPDVDPAAVEAWKKKMPFSTFADSSKPGTVIEVLKSPNNQIAMDFVDKLSKKLKEAYPDVEPTAEAWSNKLRAMFEKENGK